MRGKGVRIAQVQEGRGCAHVSVHAQERDLALLAAQLARQEGQALPEEALVEVHLTVQQMTPLESCLHILLQRLQAAHSVMTEECLTFLLPD